ncbi:MAG TPA: hypothetical protein VK559_02890 [Ferruginibacter sp.]|nr:hypothetical protein [Ferruginibacter sp.]
MFLKELWGYSKKLAVGFILFILFWTYINYKQGATAAPLFQYGMYANKYFISDTQQVIELYVNDKNIDLTKYPIADRDLLQTSLLFFRVQKPVNESIYYTIKRILDPVFIGQLMTKDNYTNATTDQEFTDWYKQLTQKIVGYPVNKLAAYEQKYVWQKDKLVPVSSPIKFNCIVANP